MAAEEDMPEIEVRPTTSGKSAFVGSSRIRVSDIAQMYEWMREEVIVERIQWSLPSLTVDQIHAALDYWRAHKKEVESEIDKDRAASENLPRA